jgi:hypothetical protein
LYKVHASVHCDLCSGGANYPKLKPESSCANRNGIARNVFALPGAPKDINEIDLLAC